LLARAAAVDDARGTAEPGLGDFVFEKDNVVGARGDEEFRDGWASRQAPQREENERHAIEFQKLLGEIPAHAGAQTSGRNDGNDFCHERANSLTQIRRRGRKKGALGGGAALDDW